MQYEAEFCEEIGTAIPLLIALLNGGSYSVRSATVSALSKLADHGEFSAVCYLDIANASVKSSFIRRLKTTFHLSFNCLRVETLMVD
jgi:hypothetical protein